MKTLLLSACALALSVFLVSITGCGSDDGCGGPMFDGSVDGEVDGDIGTDGTDGSSGHPESLRTTVPARTR